MAEKESGGATGAAPRPPVHRRIKATTVCFSEEAAPAGEFAVRVTCIVKGYLVFLRRGQSPHVLVLRRKNHTVHTVRTFLVADPAAIRTVGACRVALRGMLGALPQLRLLHLAEDEWDAVVPGDVVRAIAAAACRGEGFTFCLTMIVRRQVTHDDRALLMACKDRPAPGEQDDCAICFDGLEGECAAEMPVCEHAFHRRCISKWFSMAPTCPMCRADVRTSALREFLEMSSSSRTRRIKPQRLRGMNHDLE